jgi:hypothetical protein
MARRALVVIAFLSALLLTSPVGAQWNRDGSDRPSWRSDRFSWSQPDSNRPSWRGPNGNPPSWRGPISDRPRRRPTNAVPEPSAALLFGIGALVVRRQLHRR